jgi:geranylgeranyl reductase family protein
MKKQVSVIGAGPSGSYLAYLLARKGYKVAVYEEHPVIGRPVHCTGLVSRNIAKIIPVKNFVINQVNGAVFYSAKKKLELKTGKLQAFVVDRTKFDQHIAEMARKAGANFYLNHRFLSSRKKGRSIILKFYHRGKVFEKKTKILVGADGALSKVARSWDMFGKRKFLAAMQARVKHKDEGRFDKSQIQMYLGSACPGFFAWLVPESEKYARLGLAAGKNTLELFRRFSSRFGYVAVEKQAGVIPIYTKIKTQKGNVYLVGDAAMQVKPTTGGGIVMGLLAAEALAFSIRTRIPYPLLWKLKIGLDLKLGKIIRRKLNKLTDSDYDFILEKMSKPGNLALLKKGDMDFPKRMLFNALRLAIREPGLLKYVF